MADKIWDCGCVDADDWEMLIDGIDSELRSAERRIDRTEKMSKVNVPAGSILYNSALTDKKKLSDLRIKVESMTLCEMDSD